MPPSSTIGSMEDMLRYVNNCTDIELTLIVTAVGERQRKRREELTRKKQVTLKPGDRIQIVGSVKPRYLAGTTGKIFARKAGKFVVHLDEDCDPRAIRRFGRAPVCPASLLEKI